MSQICRAIGYFLHTENKIVILDFGLPTNELLVFE